MCRPRSAAPEVTCWGEEGLSGDKISSDLKMRPPCSCRISRMGSLLMLWNSPWSSGEQNKVVGETNLREISLLRMCPFNHFGLTALNLFCSSTFLSWKLMVNYKTSFLSEIWFHIIFYYSLPIENSIFNVIKFNTTDSCVTLMFTITNNTHARTHNTHVCTHKHIHFTHKYF